MALNRSPRRAAWVGMSLGILSLLLGQGSPYLFDWDELIYGSLARHMVVTGHWWELAINGVPFWEKPPLFFWAQALAFAGLGISEASARLPNALAGGGLIGLCIWMGSRLQGPRLGWIWGGLLATGWLPLLFAKTGLIDPLLNLWMLLALMAGFEWERARLRGEAGGWALVISGLALGLGVLTKGPIGLGLPGVIGLGYKLWHRRPWPRWSDLGVWIGVSGAVALSWFVLEIAIQGPEFWIEFVRYQWRILSTDDGHPGPVYFHLLAYGLGCFPFAALSLTEIWTQLRSCRSLAQGDRSGDQQSSAQRWTHLMLVAFGIVLGLFSVVVQTKLVHYTSLLYPIGAYLAALRLCRVWDQGSAPSWLERIGISISGLIWGGLLLALPWIGQHPQDVLGMIEDPLTQGYLSAPVDWPGYTYSSGAILWVGLLLWMGVPADRLSVARRWGVLLLSTWLSAQLFWGQIGPRLLQHTQGGAVQICQRLALETSQQSDHTPLALYGSRSFIPYFYGPLQVPHTSALWQLIPWVENHQVEWVLTWRPQQEELTDRLPLVPAETSGAFVLLQVKPDRSAVEEL